MKHQAEGRRVSGATMNITVKLGIALGMLGAAAFFATRADAKGGTWQVRKASRTQISGNSGVEKALQMGDFAHPIYEIAFSERNDKPCYMAVKGLRFVNGDFQLRSDEWDACTAHSASMKKISLHTPAAGSMEVRVVRAISVCTTDKKDSADNRLKGIRVWTSRLHADGTLTELDSVEEVRRTNCKKWHPKRECPSGQVATGLYIQKRGSSDTDDDNLIQGIGLQCSTVQRRD